MKLFHLSFLLAAAIGTSILQVEDSGAGTNRSPNPEATLNYIHSAWDTLTRSMTDCHSLVDIKVTVSPVLYMPAELPAPPEVAALEQKCHVEVLALPRHIERLADVRP
jgi:alpha,alpha-trehalase